MCMYPQAAEGTGASEHSVEHQAGHHAEKVSTMHELLLHDADGLCIVITVLHYS